ncbi:hypothetical protein ACWD6R_38480 [Streptomyces sp. NPDC005151]
MLKHEDHELRLEYPPTTGVPRRDVHRLKGGAVQLGATAPGPFGIWPSDGDLDDEDQGHEPADARATETRTA